MTDLELFIQVMLTIYHSLGWLDPDNIELIAQYETILILAKMTEAWGSRILSDVNIEAERKHLLNFDAARRSTFHKYFDQQHKKGV